MNTQRMLWFQDGVKLRTPERKWAKIDALTEGLVRTSGSPDFNHAIIDPVVCREKLFQQINLRDYSVVIDLSGSIAESIRQISFSTPVIDRFHLTKVSVVSSPRLDGAGFMVSLNPEETEELKGKVDMSRPLLIDDVAWSGRTIIEAVRLLELERSLTTVGLLCVNLGVFGEKKLGARKLLETEGMRVITGEGVVTPNDDGFHVADFLNFPDVEGAFDIVIQIQEMRERMRDTSKEVQKEIEQELKTVLRDGQDSLFSDSFTSEQMRQLKENGRFISAGGISRESLFGTNPPSWLMPSFARRANSDQLRRNRGKIICILKEFKVIMSEDIEARFETTQEIFRGKERY